MDAKDLRIEPALSDHNNEGNKYAQSGGLALQCDRNKTYQDIGSNSLAKVEVQSARPCAVIGPDRVVPPSVSTEPYAKKGPSELWPCRDNAYRLPPEYPRKLSNYTNPSRNISPRQTFQENMQRIMVAPTYNAVKINDDSNYAQIADRNISLSKNIKLNVPPEAKYCDVPYAVNHNNNEQKNVRSSDMCVSSVNPQHIRTAPHGWPPGSVNLRPPRSYGAPELYQYQEFPSCAGPRPIVPRSHRTLPEEPGYVCTDPYYSDGNIRFKHFPPVKDRYQPPRYDYISNYTNPFHPPPSFPTHKYDLQKSMPPHPFSPYAPVKYSENRVSEPILDGYQRNQHANYNMQYHNQVIHPNYGTVLGTCSQNKMHPFAPDSSIKAIPPNKLSFENKGYVDYDSSRPKNFPTADSYFVNEMGRLHPSKSQVLMPNYPNLNMHSGPPNPYFRKENAQIKNYEYMAHFRHMDPTMNIHNPMIRHPPMFSPNTLAISPTDSSISNDTNQTLLSALQEDCGYVSQSSSASVRSIDSGINRLPYDYYRRYYDSRVLRSSSMIAKTESHSNNNISKERKNIDVRQFLQMWNEGDDEVEESKTKENVTKTGSSDDNRLKKSHEGVNEQLYVLGLVNVPSEELDKYEHIQKVTKLPENIKGYSNIELLNQFEEVIESSNMSNFKSQSPKNSFVSLKGTTPKPVVGVLPRPVSPLDVEAKISQSVIHKEVGCNFEIKPCSPKMLNVEVAAPVQNILSERVIEKVTNPASMKSPMLNSIEENIDYHLMRRQDHRLNMNENVRIASCKMINTQFANMNPIDPIKSTYSLQDLESNSGLCLASLPRLDNDIELNFPEVNQQFINANKGESKVLTSTKDLPTLEMLEQSDTKIMRNDRDMEIINLDPKLISPSNMDPDKEFSKLSKYRKNKTSCNEDNELKSFVNKEDKTLSNKSAIRTDSVIIKNPDNVKKYDESTEFSTNCSIDVQQPINLTSQGSFETYKENESVSANQCIDMAIDFSLNKTQLSELTSTEIELNKESNNSDLEILEKSRLNVSCDHNTNTPKNILPYIENNDCHMFNNCDTHEEDIHKIETPTNDRMAIESNQESNSPLKDSDLIHKQTEFNMKCDEEKFVNEENSQNNSNLECAINSEISAMELLPIFKEINGSCSMENDCINGILRNTLSEDTNNILKIHEEPCEPQNQGKTEIDREFQMICNESPQSNLNGNEAIIKEEEIHIEMNLIKVNKDGHETETVFNQTPENKSETDLLSEICNNNSDTTVPYKTQNIEPTRSLSSKKEVIRDQSHIVLSEAEIQDNETLPTPNPSRVQDNETLPTPNPSRVSETNENVFDGSKDLSTHDIENDSLRVVDEGTKSKVFAQYFQLWSKKIFSPWMRKLDTFQEGPVNMHTNSATTIINNTLENSETPSEETLCDSKNVGTIKEPIDINTDDTINNVEVCDNNIADSCYSLDGIDSDKYQEETVRTTTDVHHAKDDSVPEEIKMVNNDNSLNEELTPIPNEESTLEYAKKDLVTNLTNNSKYKDENEVIMDSKISSEEEYLPDTNKTRFEDSAVLGTRDKNNDIENKIEEVGKLDEFIAYETYNTCQDEVSEDIGAPAESANTEESIILGDQIKSCNKTQLNDTKSLFNGRHSLKRSLSDSALNVYNGDEKLNQENDDDVHLVWPVKRRKINRLVSVDPDLLTQNLCRIIQHNRRNSISDIYNEDDVSFCILIDNSCIISEENEEEKMCYTELSGECLEIQQESVNHEDAENVQVEDLAASSPQDNVQCDYSDSFALDCEEDKTLENSWVEDVACIEIVISDDIAENIVISGPSSPKDADISDNDESGVFSSSEHTDKVKHIYGDKMCSDDAQYLETLYNTPQMDVNKTLISRETRVTVECDKYYDNDSLEKILSESNSNASELMNSIMPLGVSNSNNTPNDKENMSIENFTPPQSNLSSKDILEDIELNDVEQENLQPKNLLFITQDDTVHSCESSIDDVFSYKHETKEENMTFKTSSSPEVSSTTSEEQNSSILLKITNYKGSRVSQINSMNPVNNRPSCKFTEEKDYLRSHSKFSKNRPLLTKAAQKYIPPLKESIRDLKVKLTLPQHSLIKLKQLKKSKDEPKLIKPNSNMSKTPKKPKPKFEDVLMSIDEIQFQKHKEKSKKAKKSVPKVVIKKSQNGSHYASTSNKDEFNPDLTGRKWQPWVFLEKNTFIDKMAIRKKTKAIYSHRNKTFVLAEKFKKYKSVNSAKFIISQPKTDNPSTGLKYTIRLKHNY